MEEKDKEKDKEKEKKMAIEEVTIENEMQTSYLDYSMSVIIGRAIPATD
jgi:DNA gyrase/topoisomerase IV subunit A